MSAEKSLPAHIRDVLTMYDALPDAMFLVGCNDGHTLAVTLVNGVAVLRDFSFADRWRSVFVRWKNMPAVATMPVACIDAVIEHLMPYYAGTWRKKRYMTDMYRPAVAVASRLVFPAFEL